MVKKNNVIRNIALVLLVVALMFLIFFLVGKSFGFFNYAKKGEVINIISIKGLDIEIINNTDNNLNLESYPMYDSEGMTQEPFEFTITNTSSNPVDYTLRVLNDEEKQDLSKLFSTEYIRFSYRIGNGTWSEAKTLGGTNDNIIFSETINRNETRTISIKLWVSSDAPNSIQGKEFYGKLILTGEKGIASRCNISAGDTFDFEFDPDNDGEGQEQTFTAPCDGNYKIETWGAQGGSTSDNHEGGYGGYSAGEINLASNSRLYINVGGEGISTFGSNNGANAGGYNGGGSTTGNADGNSHWSSGGGATHIATSSGLLSQFESKQENLLIVAGGGGGTAYNIAFGNITGRAGSGGGYKGANSRDYPSTHQSYTALGGEYEAHESLGNGYNVGSFGAGADGLIVGGGGGFYGGDIDEYAAGGGSGYIGNLSLNNKSMYCYGCTEATNTETDTEVFTVSTTGSSSYKDTTNCPNGYSSDPIAKCAKAGNGYARITYLGE